MVQVQITESKNGEYVCEYTPEMAGQYRISVKVDDSEVRGTPAVVSVRSVATGPKCECVGPGLRRGLLRKPNEFTVHAFGDDGKGVLGAACVVRIGGLREFNQPGFLGHDASEEPRARSRRHKG